MGSLSGASPAGTSQHVLVFPFPAIGHITPLFHFAQRIVSLSEDQGVVIQCTFLTPARFHPHLLSVLNQSTSLKPHGEAAESAVIDGDSLRIVAANDGLPEDPAFNATIPVLSRSVQTMEAHVESLLSGGVFACFISDNVIPWVQDVADRHGVPRLDFWPLSVRAVSMIYHLPVLASKGYIGQPPDELARTTVDCIPGLPALRTEEFVEHLLVADPSANPVHQLYRGASHMMTRARAVLVNSTYELEQEAVDALRSYLPSLYTVGPVLPLHVSRAAAAAEDRPILEWLDGQNAGSVAYVAFGSSGSWSAEELRELAAGLEASKQPFLWVLRKTLEAADDITKAGPMEGKGRVVAWAPQVAVLRHPAVGAFLTHCGWNSVVESLSAGVPMIGWPKVADQAANVRLVAGEWRAGVALATGSTGRVSSRDVERAVRAVLTEAQGLEMRERARSIGATLGTAAASKDGSSRLNISKIAAQIQLGL